jgi:hypothetical protein
MKPYNITDNHVDQAPRQFASASREASRKRDEKHREPKPATHHKMMNVRGREPRVTSLCGSWHLGLAETSGLRSHAGCYSKPD